MAVVLAHHVASSSERIDIIDEFKEARRVEEAGDEAPLRVFVASGAAAQPANGSRPIFTTNAANRIRATRHPPKFRTRVLIHATVDVHDDRVIYEVAGWAAGRQFWGIETGEFRGDRATRPPMSGNASNATIVRRVFKYSDGRMIRVQGAFGRFRRSRHRRGLQVHTRAPAACLLIERRRRHRQGNRRPRDETRVRQNTWVTSVGTDTLKDEFLSRLSVKKPNWPRMPWPMRENGGDV